MIDLNLITDLNFPVEDRAQRLPLRYITGGQKRHMMCARYFFNFLHTMLFMLHLSPLSTLRLRFCVTFRGALIDLTKPSTTTKGFYL